MILSEPLIHLLDVNVVLALLQEDHSHHEIAQEWFDTSNRQWALCAFTEAGALRYLLRFKNGQLSLHHVTALIDKLKQRPGYRHQPIKVDWQTLTKPFSTRIHGHNQVTDAYLLGLAIQEGLVLTTFDQAILHLAGNHNSHVLVLKAD